MCFRATRNTPSPLRAPYRIDTLSTIIGRRKRTQHYARDSVRPGRFARQPMFYCFRTVVEGADMAVAVVVGITSRRWSTEPFVSDQSRPGDPFAGRRGSDSCVREQSLILFQAALFYTQTEIWTKCCSVKTDSFLLQWEKGNGEIWPGINANLSIWQKINQASAVQWREKIYGQWLKRRG